MKNAVLIGAAAIGIVLLAVFYKRSQETSGAPVIIREPSQVTPLQQVSAVVSPAVSLAAGFASIFKNVSSFGSGPIASDNPSAAAATANPLGLASSPANPNEFLGTEPSAFLTPATPSNVNDPSNVNAAYIAAGSPDFGLPTDNPSIISASFTPTDSGLTNSPSDLGATSESD